MYVSIKMINWDSKHNTVIIRIMWSTFHFPKTFRIVLGHLVITHATVFQMENSTFCVTHLSLFWGRGYIDIEIIYACKRKCRNRIVKTDMTVVIKGLTLLLIISGGNCWLNMNKNGRCTSLVKTGVSREECCGTGSLANSATASWSDGELLTPSLIFFMHVQGGVPCSRCKGYLLFDV